MENGGFHTVRGYELLKQHQGLMTSAMEDYLEMIYRNCEKEGFMRIIRLAELLNVKASSATKMVQKLGELGLLKYERYGILLLTEDGMEIGRSLLERHRIIESFLKSIGIGENLLKETELIEHNISADTLKNIDILNRFFAANPVFARSFEDYRTAYMQDI